MPVMPCKNLAFARFSMLHRTAVKCFFCSSVTGPSAKVRVISVVPSRYWPPESMSSRSRGSSFASLSGVAL